MLGGERFDSLVSRFSKNKVAGTGFALGFDRTVLAMDELKLFPSMKTKTKVLVTIFNSDLLKNSQEVVQQLRKEGINTDLYPNPTDRLDKQLKYANRKEIPYVIIIGPEESEKNTIKIKNMKTGDQSTISPNELISKIKD